MSLLLPDPGEMLAIADRISSHATTVRARARRLDAEVGALGWRGVAANAFELTALALLTGLHRSAARLDDAADALRRHARNVQHLLDTLARLENDLLGLGGSALLSGLDAISDPSGLVEHASGLLQHAAGLGAEVGALLGLD